MEGKLSDWEKSNIELFQAASPSVVYITTERSRFSPMQGVGVAQGAGSGFIWDKAGHVVTNYHVIEGASTVYVQLYAGGPIPARVVGAAQDTTSRSCVCAIRRRISSRCRLEHRRICG